MMKQEPYHKYDGVQTDILKKIKLKIPVFSEFLVLMGDVQEYLLLKRWLYSVSISGYAEAGANQLHNWLTALSVFTYVEYYLSRGMNINDFGPNLSFFFEWVDRILVIGG
jgi:methylmalonyl-CoA mutase